ncbi:MAG: glycosyltransferase [Paludibacteraceae bacterium]
MNNSIEIVVVLYQCLLEESVTFSTLSEQLKKKSIDSELIIFNNDKNQKIGNSNYLVVNSMENLKLAGAYNYALDRAVLNGRKWILLLDQDTVIPDNYFTELQKLFMEGYPSDLVAVVPVLEMEGRIVSPKIISAKMRFEHNLDEKGYTNKRVNAFNSMSLLDVQFVKSLGGFSKEYPLDMHDHWCFNQIYKQKKLVYVMDIKTVHNSSFVNFEENISVSRYRQYLRNESRFVRNELGMPVYFFYKMKMIPRSLKQFFKYKNKNFSFVTFLSAFKIWSKN